MNTNHDTTASKAHAVIHPGLHTNQAPAAQRVPSAGSLRQRGSSKRQNPQLKGKKHHPESHKEVEPSPNVSAVDQRLAKAMRTKRLDLSLPIHARAPPEPPVRGRSLHIQPFQIFPTMVIEHVSHGQHLTELWLTNHHLSFLPADIAVFTRLRVLGLAGNAIAALPEELCKLKDLEALYLEKNCLRALPAKVVFPTKLRELRLDNNQLSYFPVQITKLRLLNRLGLSHNQLKALPEQIHRLRNLVELDLDYNQLEADLPDGFLSLQRLERIGLEGNFLAERPAVLDRLPALSYIRLSGNRAKQFLPANDGVVGSTRQLLVVPKRHDGYFQCVERDNKVLENEDTGASEQHNSNHRSLEGLVPCRDQNILNMLAYYGCFLDAVYQNQTGRFRPCFYDMCGWNNDIIWDGVTNLCTSTSGEKEARKSFPSGHASFSWSTMLVLTLYLLGRSRLNCTGRCNSTLRGGKKSVMMFLCCAPLLLAAWICITRSIDNWHHYSDILAGSIVGAASAIFAFSSHYGPIFSWRYAGLPLKAIHECVEEKQGLAEDNTNTGV